MRRRIALRLVLISMVLLWLTSLGIRTFCDSPGFEDGVERWGIAALLGAVGGTISLVVYDLVMGARKAVVRWRRPPAGCCAVCGYDLRATPERCPECGTESGALAGMSGLHMRERDQEL